MHALCSVQITKSKHCGAQIVQEDDEDFISHNVRAWFSSTRKSKCYLHIHPAAEFYACAHNLSLRMKFGATGKLRNISHLCHNLICFEARGCYWDLTLVYFKCT